MFATAVLGLPLCAQPLTIAFRAEIPFEFAVGSTTAPAGNYAVAIRSGLSVIQLKGSKSYFLTTNPDQSAARSPAPTMVFHRYGDQYFLTRLSTTSSGRDIPPSRTELELQRIAAAAGQKPAVVVVAMR
jgi:hypothetical protein